jgi:uncharacterized membrane protein YkoI
MDRENHHLEGNVMKKQVVIVLCVSVALCMQLTQGLAVADKGMDLPEAVKSSIEKAFPDAENTEVEKEKWKGKVVTEVELTTKDGIHYEAYIAEDGKILKIEGEDDWFGFVK